MVWKINCMRGLKPFYSCSVALEQFNHVFSFGKGIWTLASFLPKTGFKRHLVQDLVLPLLCDLDPIPVAHL